MRYALRIAFSDNVGCLAKKFRTGRGIQSKATMKICVALTTGMIAGNIGEDDQETTLNMTDSN